MEEAPSPEGGAQDYVLFKDVYQIFHDRPLPDLNFPQARAFHVEHTRNPGQRYFAAVCAGPTAPRMGIGQTLRSIKHPNILPLAEYGPVFWPPAEKVCIVAIYAVPLGGRVMAANGPRSAPITDKVELEKIARALLRGLEEFSTKGMAHRSIRPDNLFYMDAGRSVIALGDCFTSPPAYDQPLAFETVDSAMCLPEGRGPGRLSNDFYALGVTLMCLALGHMPLSAEYQHELLDAKIKRGSYAALAGDEGLPLEMIELFRGLLNDTVDQRWNFVSVDQWFNGRNVKPTQAKIARVAQRPMVFHDREYVTTRELAHAFSKHWDEAAQTIRGEKFQIWLQRGMEDKVLFEDIQRIIGETIFRFSAKKVQDNVLVARVCIILDPLAPIRYRQIAFQPDGLPALVAAAFYKDAVDPRLMIEIIQTDIVGFYLKSHTTANFPNALKNLITYINNSAVGGGFERCLYALNEQFPCKSKLLAADYVDDITQLLPALDGIAKKQGTSQSWPMDRQIAAFIAARFSSNRISDQMNALNNENIARSTMGLINLFSVLQWYLGPESLPNLLGWLANLSTPILETYNNRTVRAEIEKEIPKYVQKGNIPAFFGFICNSEEQAKDAKDFVRAKDRYAMIVKEIFKLESNAEQRAAEIEQVGKQFAVMVSFGLSLVIIIIFLIVRMV